jgi:hypothetical protein
MSLFSQLLRPFFRHFAKEAVKSLIFEWKGARKAFFTVVSLEGIGGGVAEVAEGIIRNLSLEKKALPKKQLF